MRIISKIGRRVGFLIYYAALISWIFLTIDYINKYQSQKNYLVSMTSAINGADEENRAIRIFCMILTAPKTLDTKAIVVNQTWAKHCDKYFFIANLNNITMNTSTEYSHPLPILQPAFHHNESYKRLTDKVYKTLRDVYLRYSNYDWYLKADDDTFIFVDNLREFLKSKNSSSPVTYGYDFRVIVNHGYHSGGGGYVLSNEALMRIGPKLVDAMNTSYCPNTGTEDVDVAKCLRKVGVYPNKSIDDLGRERFHPLSIRAHIFGEFPRWMHQYAANPLKKDIECCSNTSISFHYMSPPQIQKLYFLWTNFKSINLTNIFYQLLV